MKVGFSESLLQFQQQNPLTKIKLSVKEDDEEEEKCLKLKEHEEEKIQDEPRLALWVSSRKYQKSFPIQVLKSVKMTKCKK